MSEDEQTKFERRWDEHIGEIERLKWNLTEEDQERIDEIQEELRQLLKIAETNNERADEVGLMSAEFVTYEEIYGSDDEVLIRTDEGIIKADVTEIVESEAPEDGARLGGTIDADDPEVHYVDYWRGGEE